MTSHSNALPTLRNGKWQYVSLAEPPTIDERDRVAISILMDIANQIRESNSYLRTLTDDTPESSDR